MRCFAKTLLVVSTLVTATSGQAAMLSSTLFSDSLQSTLASDNWISNASGQIVAAPTGGSALNFATTRGGGDLFSQIIPGTGFGSYTLKVDYLCQNVAGCAGFIGLHPGGTVKTTPDSQGADNWLVTDAPKTYPTPFAFSTSTTGFATNSFDFTVASGGAFGLKLEDFSGNSGDAFFRNISLIKNVSASVQMLSSIGSLIVNGGFEDLPAPSGGYSQYFGGSSIAGWSVIGNDVLVLNTTYAETNLTFNARSGNNALDITGAGNTSPADGVFQTVATTLGRTYRLGFDLGNADGSGNGNYILPSSIGVSINGGAVQNFTNAAITPNGINYARQQFTFVGTGMDTIAFTNTTPVGDNYAGLDNVTLSVPEPASWAMMLGGFGMVGGAMRRRRNAVAA